MQSLLVVENVGLMAGIHVKLVGYNILKTKKNVSDPEKRNVSHSFCFKHSVVGQRNVSNASPVDGATERDKTLPECACKLRAAPGKRAKNVW